TDQGGGSPRHDDTKLERRTKALFDDSVRNLDGAARARLAEARARALEELAPRARPFARDWRLAAAGALAALALAALALALYLVPWRTEPPAPPAMQAGVLDDLELLLTEDIEMFEAELEFYAWLEEQPELEAPASAEGDGIG